MERRSRKFQIFILAIIMLVFVFRLFFSISGAPDESFNAAVSYQLANGGRLFIDNWESFQTGNSFSSIFIWLYIHIAGSTDGIILYLRFVYLGINILIGFYLVYLLKPFISREFSLYLALFYITCAPFTYYYLYYDTALMLFMVLSLFSFVHAYKTNCRGTAYLTGFFLGLMTYSYPTIIVYTAVIIIVACILLCRTKQYKVLGFCWLGGLTLIAVFAVYCFVSGIDNLFFVGTDTVKSTVESRGIVSSSLSLSKYYEVAYQTLILNWKQIITYIVFVIFILVIRHLKKNLYPLLAVLVLTPIFFQNSNYLEVYGQFNYYLLLYMLVPVLYLLLSRESRKKYEIWIWFIWLSCIIPYFLIGFTTTYGSGKKGEMGLLPGALVFFILLYALFSEQSFDAVNRKISSKTVGILGIVMNLVIFYINTFWSDPVIRSNYIMKTGIYKGIITVNDNRAYEEREQRFSSYNLKTDGSIAVGDINLVDTYLYTSLRPHANTLWGSWNSCDVNGEDQKFDEYCKKYQYPTYIVFGADQKESCIIGSIRKMLKEKYILIIDDDFYTIYELV